MSVRKLTENEIRIRIVPTHLRWPEARTSNAWAQAHGCVRRLHDFVRNLDQQCVQVEQSSKMNSQNRAQQLEALNNRALAKLANFSPLREAERAVASEAEALNKRDETTPQHMKMKERLAGAMEELRDGIAATERLVQERCGTRERARLPA